MNKALLVIAGVAVAGGIYYVTTTGDKSDGSGFSMPSLSKSELSTLVQSQKAGYEADGFQMTEKDGVFILKASDEKKVRTFLFEKFTAMLPKSYSATLKPLKQEFLSSDENFVEGLEFDMKVIDTDDGAKLEVILTKLPESLQKDLEQAPEAKWFKDILDKGSFAYTLSMDKRGDIKGVALKDINEHIEIDNAVIDAKVAGVWAKFTGDVNAKFKMQEALEIISINVKERDNFFGLTMNNIKGDVDQTTPFDQVASSSVERISFDLEKYDKFMKFLMNGIALQSKTTSTKGFVDSSVDVAIDKTSFKVTENATLKSDFLLDNFKFALTAKHISKEAALALQTLSTSPDPQVEMDQLLGALQKMLQAGLTIDIDALNAKKITLATPFLGLEIKDFNFDLHAQLKENSLDMNMGSPVQYIPFIRVNARVALNSEDLDKLVAMQPMAGMLVNMKKMEGDLAVFELIFENGQITVNGNALPF